MKLTKFGNWFAIIGICIVFIAGCVWLDYSNKNHIDIRYIVWDHPGTDKLSAEIIGKLFVDGHSIRKETKEVDYCSLKKGKKEVKTTLKAYKKTLCK